MVHPFLSLPKLRWRRVEIRVDSGNGCRELRGKRVPIIIRNLRNIYIQNIQAKHTYRWASNAKEFPTIDNASRDIRYLYQSLVSNVFYCLPWAIALPRIGITPDTAWTYHKSTTNPLPVFCCCWQNVLLIAEVVLSSVLVFSRLWMAFGHFGCADGEFQERREPGFFVERMEG